MIITDKSLVMLELGKALALLGSEFAGDGSPAGSVEEELLGECQLCQVQIRRRWLSSWKLGSAR